MPCLMTSVKSGWMNWSENRIQAVLYDIQRMFERVDIAGNLRVVSADPDDGKFVECAVAAGANVIVSGDHHLLDLGKHGDISILSAAEFLDHFQASSAEA